jgi:hypothetical protein
MEFANDAIPSRYSQAIMEVHTRMQFMLSEEQLAQFKRDGFTTVPALIDSNTVAVLRDLYDRFLRHEFACGENDRYLGGITRQVLRPSLQCDYFKDNPAISAAKIIFSELIGQEPALNFDMLISKDPGNPNETPWHQDFAYWAMPFKPPGLPISNEHLQFWVALDDVDTSNGCMHFIPGEGRFTSRQHYIASGKPDDEGRMLATQEIDASAAVPCPLRAGGCTIHSEGTPHFTTGNSTLDRRRRAYIFNIAKPYKT